MERRLESLLAPPEPAIVTDRSRRAGTLVVLGVAAAILLMWVGPFLRDPASLPPGPDLPWYIWRTELLTTRPPEALVRFEGPLEAFKGGYRVATPITGGLLRGVADIDRYTLSMVFIAGLNALAVLAVGAAAYRYRRDPLLFASVGLFAGGTLLLNPFVGWVDNMLALLLAAAALCFLPEARHSWPPRVAIGLLLFVSYFAHPPAAGVFTAVLGGTVLLRVLLEGRRAWREERPLLGIVASAAVLALVAWRVGVWGLGRPFGDSVNPPPYGRDYFLQTAMNWVRSAEPLRFLPLMLAGLAVVLLLRRRFRSDALPSAMALWLLPVLGVLGYYAGLSYPYKRFLNVTLAPVLLAGIGTWAVVRPLLARSRRRGRRVWFGVGGAALAALILVPVWAEGLHSYRGRAHWMWPSTRSATAVVRAYIAEEPDRPIVFVLSAERRATREALYGAEWRGNWSVLRAALDGEDLNDTYVFLGSIRDLLQGRPTERGSDTLDLLSRASFEVMQRGLRGREPLVFVIHRLNDELGNRAFIYSDRSVRLGAEVSLLRGPGFAPPDPAAVAAAQAADLGIRWFIAAPPFFLAGPGDLLRGALGLALVLMVPGLLAARWFRVRDVVMGLGTVPALSLAMNAISGLLVLAVWRRPLTEGVAWAIVALSTLVGAALFLLSVRGRRGLDGRPVPEERSREAALEPVLLATGNGHAEEAPPGEAHPGAFEPAPPQRSVPPGTGPSPPARTRSTGRRS
jgi:hypothetical protein